ncbi:MAG: type VI secretion system tip protein VgrG [Zoogloeaceae bacterium]|jgi:type VI secretion system VgrG family protein|nr:type VI secretion system tip protein VgrG [Zoogloeaceae bacterium]
MNTNSPTFETELFRFTSQALPQETLHVIRFKGSEGLNELFSFTIDLVSPNPALDIGKLLSDRATFRILRENGREAVFCGYPAKAQQSGYFNGYSYYTVELRPTFWKMTQIVQSWIFLEQTLKDTVEELLRSQEFFTFPHNMEFTRSDYPKRDFAMQYDESIYDYLCWRLEDQGAYFYFAQSEKVDTVCFADAPIAHSALPDDPVLAYSPLTGLEGKHVREILLAFSLTQTQRPKRVVIRSHSWKNPNKPIVGMADVSPDGLGDVYLTDEDVEDDADATRLAQIRAEALRCRERVFSGESAIPGIRPGYTFTLKDHYNPGFNQDYLITDVTHEGSQESFINLGLGIPLEGVQDHLFYRNSFHCIEANRPFRPEKRAPRAKIAGVVHAFIDGAKTDARPELDSLGRYKILFPFDISGRGQGKASCWVRMAQQQIGKNSGMSFPLLVGTEVLVSFVDGNPDRPYITGALANAETGALVGSGNNNVSGISTAGGNQLLFNDSAKTQGIGMTTANGSGIVMSAGSLDALISSGTIEGKAAAVSSASFANVAHSTMSRTILQEVMGPSLKKYGFLGLELCKQVMEAAQKGYAEKDSQNDGGIGGIAAAKAALMMAGTIGENLAYAKDRASIYGYTVRSDGGDTMTKLQTPVRLLDVVTDCVAMIGGAIAEISTELNDVEEKAEKEKYSANKKELAQKNVYARTISDNLAEILAMCILAYRGKALEKETMGGILLHSEDANIGLHAENAIHLDSKGGLLLRAGDAKQDELAGNYRDTVRGQPILKWGSKDVRAETQWNAHGANILFNFQNDAAMSYVFGNGAAQADNYQINGYLADISHLRYAHTTNLVENIGHTRKSLAQKHIIVSGDDTNGSALVVQNAGTSASTIQAPSGEKGIYLSVHGDNKTIQLEGNNFVIKLNDDGVEIKKKDEKSCVTLDGDGITLALEKNNKVSVELKNDSVALKCASGIITIKDTIIELDNVHSQVKIKDIQFDGKQNAINNIYGISNNAIRIMP